MKVQAAALLLLPLAATAFVPAAAPAAKGRSVGMAAEGMSRKDALKAVGAGAFWVPGDSSRPNRSIDQSPAAVVIPRPIFNPPI